MNLIETINKYNKIQQLLDKFVDVIYVIDSYERFERWNYESNDKCTTTIDRLYTIMTELAETMGICMVDSEEDDEAWLNKSFEECAKELEENVIYIGTAYIEKVESNEWLGEYMGSVLNDAINMACHFALDPAKHVEDRVEILGSTIMTAANIYNNYADEGWTEVKIESLCKSMIADLQDLV